MTYVFSEKNSCTQFCLFRKSKLFFTFLRFDQKFSFLINMKESRLIRGKSIQLTLLVKKTALLQK